MLNLDNGDILSPYMLLAATLGAPPIQRGHAMSRNLKRDPDSNKPASDATPSGMKVMSPAPNGGKVRNISGPSIKGEQVGPKGAPYMDKGKAQSS